jgi:dTDP-4-dehydrorhamnose 3,5-epimerase
VQIQELEIPDIKTLTPVQHRDNRGFFSEIYNRQTLLEAGITLEFVQENYSCSSEVNTVRGLHFQTGEFQQDKLVQVVSGAILDVAVDLRQGSPWYGQYVCAEISANNWQQILIPKGFAHGFLTLQPDTAVMYRVTAHYSAAHDAGIRWNDPDIGIDWPISQSDAVLSDKDTTLPFLADCDTLFQYDVTHS